MHIAILSLDASFEARVRDAFAPDRHRYTVAPGWSEIASSFDADRPDLVVVERQALSRASLADLAKIAGPGRWPPVLIADEEISLLAQGLAAAGRLAGADPQYYEIGKLRIDTRRKRATIGERWVALPPLQYRLLLTLARRSGEVLDAQQLLRIVWGYESTAVEARELVKVHIRQIRRRLGLHPDRYHYIRSVRGFGYVLAPPDEPDEETS
jgi:DNA-binding winged helix-turn-helix (wHTH) protein